MNKTTDILDKFIATSCPVPNDLFFKVATIAGWQTVWQSTGSNTYFGTRIGANADAPELSPVPRYDLSIDAIWSLYEEFGLYPSINRSADGNCHVSAFPHHSISTQIFSVNDPDLAIALCKLLVIISEKIE